MLVHEKKFKHMLYPGLKRNMLISVGYFTLRGLTVVA